MGPPCVRQSYLLLYENCVLKELGASTILIISIQVILSVLCTSRRGAGSTILGLSSFALGIDWLYMEYPRGISHSNGVALKRRRHQCDSRVLPRSRADYSLTARGCRPTLHFSSHIFWAQQVGEDSRDRV